MPSATQGNVFTNYATDTKVSQVIQKPEFAVLLHLELDAIYKEIEKVICS